MVSRRDAGFSASSPPPARQRETGECRAALSRFGLVPIETGGCSCLVYPEEQLGTGRAGTVLHLGAAAPFPRTLVPSPLPCTAPAPRQGCAEPHWGSVSPSTCADSPGLVGLQAGCATPCPGRSLCGTRDLCPAVCWITCCSTVLLVLPAMCPLR